MTQRSGRERERQLGWKQEQTNTGKTTDEPLQGDLADPIHRPKQGRSESRREE